MATKENYNPSFDTPLSPVDEALYRIYKQMFAATDKSGTYDYRGAYLAGVTPNTGNNPAQFGHFTDQFKKPNYPTFSVESQYAGAYPEKAGRWQGDTFIPPAYRKGTSNVKKYQGGTDSVNAKLTPKEAVLNRNAAELLGRDAIKRLNAHGNMLAKRGVDLASDPAPYPSTENLEGYQMGSSDVEHEDQGESMMKAGYRFTPQDLAEMHRQRLAQGQVRRAQVMNEKPVFQFQGGTSDVKDLLADTENTFYGGGHAPAPTPTPTPKPRINRYQYGTDNVRRRTTDRYSAFGNPNVSTIYRGGVLSPEDNPAYQAAIMRPRLQRGDLTTIRLPSGGTTTVPTSSAGLTAQSVPGSRVTQIGNQLPINYAAQYAKGFGAPTPTIQGGYQLSGGVANPIENLTPQQRIAGGAGSTFDYLRSNPALAATGSFLTNAASRIAGFFGSGDTGAGFPPAANAQPPPMPTATPYQTPSPSPTPYESPFPTPTPQDEIMRYQYGTSNVMPRRYSDYY